MVWWNATASATPTGSPPKVWISRSSSCSSTSACAGRWPTAAFITALTLNTNPATAHRDRHGALWFGTTEGISRFVPHDAGAVQAPPVVIQSLRVANRSVPVPAMGVLQAADIRIEPNEQRLQVEFVAFDSQARYQHRLEGVNEWSAPSTERSVQFEGLAPGDYRFEVRAVGEDGITGGSPAVVYFHVLPPVWRRWWFLALCAAALAGLGYALHRYRMAQLLAIERVRLRIASDLHDDIGSSLSQVSMLGELARRTLDGQNHAASDIIERMASASREAVASMSDIVWSIHPHRDRMSDLTQRMRRFAADLLSARDIDFEFSAPATTSEAIPPEVRRDLFLIFKESVHNAAKHSGCTLVKAELTAGHGELRLRVEDNGRGFDPAGTVAGHGLATMEIRAKRLGGHVTVEAGTDGRGTVVSATVPT